MADILISDISNGSISTGADNKYIWTGSGIFDKLMIAVNGNIKVQFDNGHINTSDYANVYLGALQSAIQSSMDFLLKEKLTEEQIAASQEDTAMKKSRNTADIGLIAKQELMVVAQTTTEASNNTVKINQAALLTKQGLLVERQKAGFDDDAKGKLLKQVMDSWAVGFSVSQTDISVPDSIKVNVLDSITSNIMTGLNITKKSDPLGES